MLLALRSTSNQLHLCAPQSALCTETVRALSTLRKPRTFALRGLDAAGLPPVFASLPRLTLTRRQFLLRLHCL